MAKKSKKSLKEKFDKAYGEMREKNAKERAARGKCSSCGKTKCDCGCGK